LLVGASQFKGLLYKKLSTYRRTQQLLSLVVKELAPEPTTTYVVVGDAVIPALKGNPASYAGADFVGPSSERGGIFIFDDRI